MAREETSLVIGRGEVFFEAFEPGTRQGFGERYIGNTPTFQISRSVERLERYRSHKGQKVKTEAPVVSESHAVQFITDNIVIENVGMWYGREGGDTTIPAINEVVETFPVRRGNFIQLGKSKHPWGVREVENVEVRVGGVLIAPAGNYELDATLGRIEVLPTSPDIPDGGTITVNFEWNTIHTNAANSQAADVYGALRFVSLNQVGPKRHYYFPFVRLQTRGAVDLKGDQWQQIPFEIEVLRLNPWTEQVYVDETTFVGLLEDEQAIIDLSPMTLTEFPFFENELDVLVNTTMPAHEYS